MKCPAKLEAMDSNYSFSASNGIKIKNKNLLGRTLPPWDQQGADEWKNS